MEAKRSLIGEETVIARTCQRWLVRFCSGDFSLKDEPRMDYFRHSHWSLMGVECESSPFLVSKFPFVDEDVIKGCSEGWFLSGRVVVYRASTPQVWGSINGLGKIDSAFYPRYIGSINEYQACLGS
ncbi:hypothetical protein TNCV_4021491 [Trichonephila clavipes]|nr:hypothetical protein TNCV_4021491 [Trichonephila clavipes]